MSGEIVSCVIGEFLIYLNDYCFTRVTDWGLSSLRKLSLCEGFGEPFGP